MSLFIIYSNIPEYCMELEYNDETRLQSLLTKIQLTQMFSWVKE